VKVRKLVVSNLSEHCVSQNFNVDTLRSLLVSDYLDEGISLFQLNCMKNWIHKPDKIQSV